MTRSSTLLAVAAALLAAVAAAEAPALKSVAPPGLRIGVALGRKHSDGKDPAGLALVARHFNQVTPGERAQVGDGPPGPAGSTSSRPTGSWRSARARHVVVGHVLLWHQQTPAWVFDGERPA